MSDVADRDFTSAEPSSTSTQARPLDAAGEHTIAELAELFEVSRPTVYRCWSAPPP